MTDKKDETPKAADLKSADPKRPHATIDLKATEVKSSTGKPDPAKPADPKAAAQAAAQAQANAAQLAATAAVNQTATGKPSASATPAATAAKAIDPKAADPKKAAPTPPPARARAGFGSTLTHMIAGIIGGGMAWYGATTLGPQYGLTPAVSDPKTVTLENKLAALEKSLADKSSSNSGELAAKITSLQADVAKLEDVSKSVAGLSASQAKLAEDTKALAGKAAEQVGIEGPGARINKLEEQLKLMSAAATGDPQAGKLPQIAALSGRLVDMETTLNNQLSALRKTVSQELEQRLTLTNETSEAAKSGTNRIDRDLAAFKSQAASTTQKLDTLRSDADRLTTAVQGIRDTTNEVKTALDSVKSDIDAKFKAAAKPADVASAIAPVAGKIAALEQNVQAVVKSEEDRKLSAERILLSLELNNLKRVVDRGQKYATELGEVKKAAGAKLDLSVLDRYKDTGITTLAELTREFTPVSSAILDAQADTGDGSVVGRVIASARSVIAVRKINYDAADKSAEAIVGRIEAALRDGNSAAVLEEAKNIPPKAANAAQAWLVKIEARGAVDRAIASLEASLKSSLTGAAPAPAAPAAAPAATPPKS
ncbi:MAG: hypothetical protein ABL901_13740 [Hyphomicrobiaceae bacterium]